MNIESIAGIVILAGVLIIVILLFLLELIDKQLDKRRASREIARKEAAGLMLGTQLNYPTKEEFDTLDKLVRMYTDEGWVLRSGSWSHARLELETNGQTYVTHIYFDKEFNIVIGPTSIEAYHYRPASLYDLNFEENHVTES